MKLRPWKVDWPHYVRVRHGEFVSGTLSNGVSLNELMNVLGSDAFASTQRNAANRMGNTDPRRAYSLQASVELTPQGIAWLNDKFEKALEQHGTLAGTALKRVK